MLTSPKPRDGLEDTKYREKETFNDGFVRSGVWWLQQVIYSLTHRSLRPSSSLAEYSESVTQSCPALLRPHGLHNPWNSSEQNTGVGSLSLLQGIFPTCEALDKMFREDPQRGDLNGVEEPPHGDLGEVHSRAAMSLACLRNRWNMMQPF